MPTDVFGAPLRALMDTVKGQGGTVFYDKIRYTAVGAGTSRVSISTTYQVPQRAVEILAIRPSWKPTTNAAAVGDAAMFDIKGTSYAYQPTSILTTPIGANLGALTGGFQNAQNWWELHVPCAPGDTYDWGATPLVGTLAHRAGVEIMYSTVRTGLPIIYGIDAGVQTITAATAGDFTLPAAGLALPQANQLVEVSHVILPSGVQVAADSLAGDMTYSCTAMTPIQQFRVGIEISPPGVGASFNSFIADLSRFYTPGYTFQTVSNPVVTGNLNVDTAITNTSFFDWLCRFTKAGAVASAPRLGSS
jgi:hypothetical protein